LILPRLSTSFAHDRNGTHLMADIDLSVIIPAHNEEGWIDRCLAALMAQKGATGRVEILVVANACRDRTVAIAESYAPRAAARDWTLRVLELAQGGKILALNAGDAAARGAARPYLDADIACDPDMLAQLGAALTVKAPRYATGTLAVAPAKSWVTRAYASVWRRLPFVRSGAVGAGLFAVNAAGRARWGAFPPVISDDTFVRLSFAPDERIEVPARYHWPMVEGFANLVRVRRRQDAGVDELRRLYPALFANEGKTPLTTGDLLRLALRVPLGFLVYLSVHIAVRLRPPAADWTRGR
jgi:glycosyltransferase involved in cell wall biosynthesis